MTLWHPFWAYNKYDVRDWTDRRARSAAVRDSTSWDARGFTDDFPEVANWLGSLKLEESQYGELESLVSNYGEGKEDDAVTEWSDSHPEFDFKKS